MLLASFSGHFLEAGCDEAGRGCLAGPVFAAAVILPRDYAGELLDDSKKLSSIQREKLRGRIENEALAWAVGVVDNETIDRVNILNASIKAMHLALDQLAEKPELILVDGNRFRPYPGISHQCIVRGDASYQSIAAASILAKTHRDEFMRNIDREFPEYGWGKNKGYPTPQHRKAIADHGLCTYHRKSFKISLQMKLFAPNTPW